MNSDIFGHKIVAWYRTAHRKLPWRETRDPYRIWLSEVILQQTRVAQGYPYYEKFIAHYPDVHHLAAASEKEVLHLWQGLGYYSRARNMHATARAVVEQHGGLFPQTYDELIRLKGIGDYTASAIASFAFDEQTAVVDGNVFRVLSRYYGLTHDISLASSRKFFKEAAKAAMPNGQASIFNQAIMEFGALQCVPSTPPCATCVVNTSCFAFAKNAQSTFPVKTKKTKITKRHIHYLVVQFENQLALMERTGNDIWRGLYDFYPIETPDEKEPHWTDILPKELIHTTPEWHVGPMKHVLSHQLLFLTYWKIHLPSLRPLPFGLKWYRPEEVEDLPKPLPVNSYLRDFL